MGCASGLNTESKQRKTYEDLKMADELMGKSQQFMTQRRRPKRKQVRQHDESLSEEESKNMLSTLQSPFVTKT